MATNKPRINVTLEPHRYHLFKRMAALQGVSMSALIGELLETVADPVERVCVILEAAQKAPGDLKAGLRAAVDRAESSLLPAAQAAVDQFDLFVSDATEEIKAANERAAGAAQRRTAARAGGAAPDPRPVTRGSTPLRKGAGGNAGKDVKLRRRAAPSKVAA